MSSVYIPIPVAQVIEAEDLPSLTYRLDLARGRIVGQVDGLAAVNQAIRKVIITPRFKCLIYDNQYGSEIEDVFITHDASWEYIQAAAEGFVRDALRPDSRILAVYDFQFAFVGDKAEIFFRADTIFGQTEVKEVVY